MRRFYCDVIGFELIFETAWAPGVPAVDAMMELKDVAAECARLSAAGMRLHTQPISIGLPIMGTYGRDPDGNIIELLEVLDESFALHMPGDISRPAIPRTGSRWRAVFKNGGSTRFCRPNWRRRPS